MHVQSVKLKVVAISVFWSTRAPFNIAMLNVQKNYIVLALGGVKLTKNRGSRLRVAC